MNEEELIPTYARRDITINKGDGVYLFDSQGNRYLDFMSNYGASLLGHNNEYVNNAIKAQLARLTSLHTSFYNEQRAKLSERLVEITPKNLNRVYFGNSGTEAVEAAIKFAWVSSGRREIISAKLGYHGKTLGALSATTTSPKYRKSFLPLLSGFSQVSYNNTESLKENISQNTAAVILEPIQGESGVRPAKQEYLRAARDLCDDAGALLIFDEVQTGFRTGTWTTAEHYNIEPDIICLSKGIGNGFPISATLVTENISNNIPRGSQTCTFGGNPLACTAAISTIEYIEQNKLHTKTRELGEYFIDKLRAIENNLIREVRGLGFMIGVELKRKSSIYLKNLQEQSVLALPAGSTVVRFLPPLIIEKEHIDEVVEKFDSSLNSI